MAVPKRRDFANPPRQAPYSDPCAHCGWPLPCNANNLRSAASCPAKLRIPQRFQGFGPRATKPNKQMRKCKQTKREGRTKRRPLFVMGRWLCLACIS